MSAAAANARLIDEPRKYPRMGREVNDDYKRFLRSDPFLGFGKSVDGENEADVDEVTLSRFGKRSEVDVRDADRDYSDSDVSNLLMYHGNTGSLQAKDKRSKQKHEYMRFG